MKKPSIRFKVTAITVVAILITIITIFASSYPLVHSETDLISVQMMNLIGKDTKQVLDQYFIEIEQSVRLVANMAIESLDSVALVELGVAGKSSNRENRTPTQIEELDQYIAAHCEQVKKNIGAISNHTNGVEAYYYVINPEISESVHGFFYARVGKAGFMTKEPINARLLDEKDAERNQWYYKVIQKGGPCWVGPYTWNYPDEVIIFSYSMPVYSTGELIGVVGMDIPMKTLIEQISPIRIYQTGFASLYDSNGNVLYHPASKKGNAPNLSNLSVSEELLSQDNSGDAIIRYTVNGETRQLSFFTLNNGMKLFLSVPVKEINALWYGISRSVILITILTLILFSIFMSLTMGILTRPLLRLTSASQRLANADYDVVLDYKGQDEIGTLTTAFSKMRNDLKKYIEDLNHQAYFDQLTNVPNMRNFFNLAQNEFHRLKKEGQVPAILFFDLVGMKYYNRQYGFQEGDKLLCEMAHILVDRYGSHRLCRFSEDHFVVMTDTVSMIEGIQDVFSRFAQANNGNSVPVHVGIYETQEEEIHVSTACDRAKYSCEKHKGSYVSEYFFFDHNMIEELELVRHVINHLDQALEEHWISVYYQPIISSETGRLCDEEALSRWQDPERGMISPGYFITILEKARLIYKVDLFVLDEVLKKMKEQAQLGMEVVPHSVNLSRTDFDSCDIVEEIRRRVDAAGLPHHMITVEVTESTLGSNYDFLLCQVARFHELGFKVWMDDFGSGYSSLDILHELPFDLLKFDMHFLHNFEKGEENKIVLTNLIRMARELGIDTLCEGVETSDQALFLRKVGCQKLQGFYFSKPVPFDTIKERNQKGIFVGLKCPETKET